jgi:hypothetical protein
MRKHCSRGGPYWARRSREHRPLRLRLMLPADDAPDRRPPAPCAGMLYVSYLGLQHLGASLVESYPALIRLIPQLPALMQSG